VSLRIERYKGGRHWAVLDAQGQLVCLCVYRKGACEVARRLERSGEKDCNCCSQHIRDIDLIREQRQEIVFSQE